MLSAKDKKRLSDEGYKVATESEIDIFYKELLKPHNIENKDNMLDEIVKVRKKLGIDKSVSIIPKFIRAEP